jgi:hypothetical protein
LQSQFLGAAVAELSAFAETMTRTILIVVFVMGLLSRLFGGEKPTDTPKDFPPVPAWQPDITIPLEKVIDRFRYYTDDKKDFVVLKHGTCVVVSDGLTDQQAGKEALETVSKIFNYHPDMNPKSMDDGNILIFYNHPAYTVVLDEITKQHIDTIRTNHLKALARAEVLMTPAGPNKFDDFGMKALFGRCYFFMDAKKPEVFSVARKRTSEQGGPANRSQPGGSETNRTSSAAGSGG